MSDSTTTNLESGTSGSHLQTERGVTHIADSVVGKIAALAAREVNGVVDLGGPAASAIGGVVGRIRGEEHSTAGVGVEVGERQAAIDMSMKCEYPLPLHEVADAVRENVVDRVESMTGLEVIEVNISVLDLAFPGGEEEEAEREAERQRQETASEPSRVR
ncbi:MAG: Asp23/Gls24 family envelope stress response protein [Actinobacteria bacterium]|nr:Asp23/Gls24 family envelope stress response protein [Actinomycetota bacterium]